jgi:protein CpxP
MKNLILLSLFMLSFVFSVSAQNGQTKTKKTPAEKATFFADKAKTDLGLTDDQRQKVYDAKLDQLTQREAIKTKYNNDNKAGEADFRANNEKFRTAMKSILTPEQHTKWTSAKKAGKNGKAAPTDDND